MAAPAENNALGRVVILKIILRYGDGKASFNVALVLQTQGVAVVFHMAAHKDLAAGIRGEDMQPGPAAFGQHTQRRAGVHLLAAKLGMAGMGRVEHFVKAAHQRVFRACHPVGENAEHFLRQYALVDAVMVIQRSLRAPADVHCAVHVRFAVFKNGAKLGPVIYFLVGQHFHGRAGNDHAVEALGFDLVEGFVKRLQMRSGHMRALVGIHVQQRQLHLQGAVGQHAGDLCFGGDFRRHQIYQQDAQRADVLRHGAGPVHDEHVFFLERLVGGQGLWNDQRHKAALLSEPARGAGRCRSGGTASIVRHGGGIRQAPCVHNNKV